MIPDFNKTAGLIPVVIKDAVSLQVPGPGSMNEGAYNISWIALAGLLMPVRIFVLCIQNHDLTNR